jgi:hypothetical protein
LAEEKLLQREREAEKRRIEEREREKERLEKARENEIARHRLQTVEKPTPTGGYVPPYRRSEPTTNREGGPWRRSESGRGTAPDDGPRRRDSEQEWRRSDSGREDTEKRKPEPPSRRTIEEMEWRRQDSGRGSTNEERTWRRTSTASSRDEPSVKQESSWRRGGPPQSDRGDRSDSKWTKSREDSWRKDTEDSDQALSSRGSTRVLKSEGSWRPRAKQSGDQVDQFHDEPDEDESLFRSENNQAPVSSGRQNVPIEPDDDGFIPVTKGKRRGKNQPGHGHDLE